MKLYLDDERVTPEGWTRAYTPEQAIAYLDTGLVDTISLDHDLGLEPEERNGYMVASYLEEKAYTDPDYKIPETLLVHSANPAGVANIQKAFASIKRALSRR